MLVKNRLSYVAAFFLLTACINTNLTAPELKLTKQITNQNALSNEFINVCLSAKGNVLGLRKVLPEHGWLEADDTSLKNGGLQKLRKLILKIPGGGGRYWQTQTLHMKTTPKESYFLNLEEQFLDKRKTGTYCAVYSQSDFFKTCTAIGKVLNLPPDRNQKYSKHDAHFIGWNISINKLPAKINCETTPNSKTLPYQGVVLSLSVTSS